MPYAESPDFFSRGYNDLKVGDDGDLSLVVGTNKLAQDILKFLTTKAGEQPFFPEYGADFEDLIGLPQDEATIVYIDAKLKDKIKEGLKALQTTLTDRPDNEQIGALTYFNVSRESNREVNVEFSIITKSLEDITLVLPAFREEG